MATPTKNEPLPLYGIATPDGTNDSQAVNIAYIKTLEARIAALEGGAE